MNACLCSLSSALVTLTCGTTEAGVNVRVMYFSGKEYTSMTSSTAFAPSHLTLVFSAFPSEDPFQSGSIGFGLNVAEGMTCTVRLSSSSFVHSTPASSSHENDYTLHEILKKGLAQQFYLPHLSQRHRTYFNSSRFEGSSAPPVLYVFEQLGYTFESESFFSYKLPIGAGFGSSAAASLSLALALNDALGAGLSLTELADIAHLAELSAQTGLGDVTASLVPGFELRIQPGAPSVAKVRSIHQATEELLSNPFLSLYIASNGPISTARILSSDTMTVINALGKTLTSSISTTSSLSQIFEAASRFNQQVNLLSSQSKASLHEYLSHPSRFAAAVMIGDSIVAIGEEPPRSFTHVVSTSLDLQGPRLI